MTAGSGNTISPTFFGHMIQGGWVADDGSLYQPVTTYFGLLRLWDSRAVWHKMEQDATALEANILYAQSVGAKVMFTFGEPPASAILPGYTKVPTMEAWRAFVSDVIKQADGRVGYWEGPNEPGIPGYWDGTPELLVEYERERYQITKAMNPSAVVLSPAFTEMALPRGQRFIESYLAAGGAEWCDVIAFHGYAAKPEDMIPDIAFIRDALGRYHLSKPLWNTEYVIGPVDPALRPAYMAQSLVIQASLGVQGAVWDAEIPGSEDYNDPTMRTVADWLIGATVGPLAVINGVRWVTRSKASEEMNALSWTENSFPMLGAAHPSPPRSSTKGGCNKLFRIFRR